MPLGEPMGGETPYIEQGKITRVWLAAVPVSNLEAAVAFYAGKLGLTLQLWAKEKGWAELGPDEPLGKIALYVPDAEDVCQPGGPTGIVFDTDSIYDLHRKLVDEGVRFKLKPEKRDFGGLMAVFTDPDGNEFQVVEDPQHYQRWPRPPQPPAERCDESRSCRRAQG
jgi:catechol 2,3-dioxygenase-like lactoylglutathione lyase family enzyme